MDLPAEPSTSTSAPPLPYRLQTSGIGWLVAAVTVVDDAMVGWLAGLVGRGWWGLRGLACIGSWWVLYTMLYGLMLVLLVLRRWRHLIIWWVVGR